MSSIRNYKTACDQIVTWTHDPNAFQPDYMPAHDTGSWECSGCKRTGYDEPYRAEQHARRCREC